MADQCVAALFETLAKAQTAIHILDRAGFPLGQVSLVSADLRDAPELAEELNLGDDSVRAAAIGAGLGGVAGILVGLTAVTITGVGVVFILGPVAGGAMAGAFLGALGGWGVHADHLRHYQQRVKEGGVLVVAHGDPLQLVDAERILKETDMLEIHVHARTGDDAGEIEES